MRARERISCSVGNVFNDLYSQLLFSFEIVFFMKVLELSASQAGLIVLIGQVSDALMSPLTGYLGDNVNVPFLSNKIGRRKSWHLIATVLMAISIPLLFNECFLCDGRDPSWLSLVYFGFFSALINACFNVVEINHLAFITTVAENVEEFTTLSALRTMLSFVSGVYVYAIVWALLGQDSGDSLGPNNLSDFAYLSWIATGTGVFFATIFYIGKKESKKPFRKRSIYMDFTPNISGLFMSRKTSFAHTFVDMLVGQSNEKTDQEDQDTEDQENRQRKRSLLEKFVDIIFYNEQTEHDDTSSEIQMQKPDAKESQNEATKQQMFLEVKQLDRDRKKSLLMRVIDGLLDRSDQRHQDFSTGNIEDHIAVTSGNKECNTGKNDWRDTEKEMVNSYSKKEMETFKDGHEKRELEVDQKDHTSAAPVKSRQRRNGIVSTPNDGELGLFNPGFAFVYEGSDETEKDCSSDTSVATKQKKSVTFSLSESDVLSEGDERKEFKLDESIERSTTVSETIQGRRDEDVDFVEDGNIPSVSEDAHEVLGLPVSPSIYPSKKTRPKTIKDWLRDLNLYKVAVVFTCSRLVQGAAYTYLPLFLTERLQFTKEAIAYFPLVLLVSASLSSILCAKMNEKIGAKWSYLLAAFLVMSGSVWSYFQTPSTKQTTYAPVVIIGCGMSIMYVMALAFITELIGENKGTSGSVISIITIIARLSSGGLVFGIQEFYPEEDTGSKEAIGNYVQHVFAMTLGILTLFGFLLVLFFQPSACKIKEAEKDDIEAQAGKDKSLANDVISQVASKCTETPNVSPNLNRNTAMVHSCSEDTKL